MRLLTVIVIVFTFACTSQSATDTPSHTATDTLVPSETATSTLTPTETPTLTYTPTETPSKTFTPTKTPTRTLTPIPIPVNTPVSNPAPSGTIVTTEAEFLSCILKANSTCIVVGRITLTKRTTIRTAGVTVIGFGSTALLTNSVSNVYAVLEVVDTRDVTIKNIRIRRTPNIADGKGDGLSITRCNGCVVENISIAWSIDGGLDINTSQNVIVRNSIIAEPLRLSTHVDGSHSMGMLVFSSNNIDIIGNLFISAKERNPRIVSSQSVDVISNRIVNFGSHPTVISSEYAPSYVNYIGNVIVPGIDSPAISYGVAITGVTLPIGVYVENKYFVRESDWRYIVNTPYGVPATGTFDIETVGAQPRDAVDTRLVECTVSRDCVIRDSIP